MTCLIFILINHQERNRLIQECKKNTSALLKQERLSCNEEEEDDHGISFGYKEENGVIHAEEGGKLNDDEINFVEI